MKRLFLSILCIVALSQAVSAQRFYIGGGAGQTAFDDHFGNGIHANGKALLISDAGLAIDAQLKYIVAEGREVTDPQIKMVPLLVGISHYFNPSGRVNPYFGGSIGAAYMSSGFDNPAFLYGWKTGIFVHADKDLGFYLDIETLYLDDETTGLEIRPWLFSAGMMIKLGGTSGPRIKEKKMSQRKRRKLYERRRLREPREERRQPNAPRRF
jgi:hypothetical protein